jgi:hypothetical protein
MSYSIATETRRPIPQLLIKELWTGRILSGLAVLFLQFDATGKVLRLSAVVEGTTQLGYPDSVIVPIVSSRSHA